MAEIFPNEGLDLIYAGYPKGATGPANTWLGLFTSWSASTVAGSAAVIASWAEYVRLRARMTMADSRLQQRVAELQCPDVPIRVSRLIGVTAESAPQSRVA